MHFGLHCQILTLSPITLGADWEHGPTCMNGPQMGFLKLHNLREGDVKGIQRGSVSIITLRAVMCSLDLQTNNHIAQSFAAG